MSGVVHSGELSVLIVAGSAYAQVGRMNHPEVEPDPDESKPTVAPRGGFVLPEETEVDEATAEAQPAAEAGAPSADVEGDAAAAQAGGEGEAETAKSSDPAASADPDAEGAGEDAAPGDAAEEAQAEPGES